MTPAEALARRLAAGKRMVDIAVTAGCAVATVRSFEHGIPVRQAIESRLQGAYAQLAGPATAKPVAAQAVAHTVKRRGARQYVDDLEDRVSRLETIVADLAVRIGLEVEENE